MGHERAGGDRASSGLDVLIAGVLDAIERAEERDLGAASDRIAERCRGVRTTFDRGGGARGDLIESLGRARLIQRKLALRAWEYGEHGVAERAALRYLGFEPPTRASGDLEKALPVDARYRRVRRELLLARVRLLTGGRATRPPPCCEEITRLATRDPSGFAAIELPRASETRGPSDERWLLSPLDTTRGFVPCSYDCATALAARRDSLSGRDFTALRATLSVGLLQLAPGIDVLLAGAQGRRPGCVRPEGIYLLHGGDVPPTLLWLAESLVVRRLLAGSELRFDGASVAARQGLVFVKMLHRGGARWLDWAGGSSTTSARMPEPNP